jgi:hypothetical protein
MADQIEARIAADGGLGAVPGTDGATPSPDPTPAAAPSTPDSVGTQGPPEAIPYARFKEVNDSYQSLKGYEELAQYGYDPDSLGRLAAFEAQYMTDPTGTWLALAQDLDLPQEVRDALETLNGGVATPPADDQTPPQTPPGSGAGPQGQTAPAAELPPEVQETLRWAQQKREEEARNAESAQTEAVLSAVTSHWDTLDKEDGLETPDNIKLTFVSAAAARGGYKTAEELAEAARTDLLAYRDSTLGSAVGSRRPGTPLAVPGSAPGSAGPVKFGSLRDASRAAAADLEQGRLPSGSGA